MIVEFQGPYSDVRYRIVGDNDAVKYFQIAPISGIISLKTNLLGVVKTVFKVGGWMPKSELLEWNESDVAWLCLDRGDGF